MLLPDLTRRLLADLRPELRALENAEATRNDIPNTTESHQYPVPDRTEAPAEPIDESEIVRTSIAECRRFQLASRAALIEALGEHDPLARDLVAEELGMLARETERMKR